MHALIGYKYWPWTLRPPLNLTRTCPNFLDDGVLRAACTSSAPVHVVVATLPTPPESHTVTSLHNCTGRARIVAQWQFLLALAHARGCGWTPDLINLTSSAPVTSGRLFVPIHQAHQGPAVLAASHFVSVPSFTPALVQIYLAQAHP
jgi:hypothetical protein